MNSRSTVLPTRPHSDVDGRQALRIEPLESDIHELRAETQVVMARQHVELLNFSRGRLAILDGQLARAHRDESDRRRVGKRSDLDRPT